MGFAVRYFRDGTKKYGRSGNPKPGFSGLFVLYNILGIVFKLCRIHKYTENVGLAKLIMHTYIHARSHPRTHARTYIFLIDN